METARFSLSDYQFDKVILNLDQFESQKSFVINFVPSGEFITKDELYMLTFVFTAGYSGNEEPVVLVRCKAIFKFTNVSTIDDLPPYFYNNAIAILFPYVRAFVSTVTLQANIQPLLLPTLNLSNLQDVLKEHTTVK